MKNESFVTKENSHGEFHIALGAIARARHRRKARRRKGACAHRAHARALRTRPGSVGALYRCAFMWKVFGSNFVMLSVIKLIILNMGMVALPLMIAMVRP